MKNQPAPAPTQGSLRPRARLLRTLGNDLISSEKVAIIELVKNSYDADATVVTIRFCEQDNHMNIEIVDDGHGMTPDTIRDSWLDIASDLKSKKHFSKKGTRRVLGEKGIGRLASSRLGDHLEMVTRAENDSIETRVSIDWTDFDRPGAYLDEIIIPIHAQAPEVFLNNTHGVSLHISNSNKIWTSQDVFEVRTALSRLIRPNPQRGTKSAKSDFEVVLELPDEFSELSGPIEPPSELKTPHYRLFGEIAQDGTHALKYVQAMPHLEVSIETENLWENPNREPSCGPLYIDLSVWDRDSASLTEHGQSMGIQSFKRLLNEITGVSIYRDEFRILPFGESGDDWLNLDRRRVQNPTLRVSNNQIVGNVFISADTNAGLRDQTNREGLLSGDAYRDLQSLVSSALSELEYKRYAARRPKKAQKKQTKKSLFDSFYINELKDKFIEKYPDDKTFLSEFDDHIKEIETGVAEVKGVISRYSRLITLGSLVDRVLHDGRTALAQVKNSSRHAQSFLEQYIADPPSGSTSMSEGPLSRTSAKLETVITQSNLLSQLFDLIAPFGGRKMGRAEKFELGSVIDQVIQIHSDDALAQGINLFAEGVETEVRVDKGELLTMVTNLVQNGMYWVGKNGIKDDRSVKINYGRIHTDDVFINVSDSGPGVSEENKELIFDPYFSTRQDGVGLGLSIVGNIAADFYGGSLSLVDSDELGGAKFEIRIKKRV